MSIFSLYELITLCIIWHFNWDFEKASENKPNLEINHGFDIGKSHLHEVLFIFYEDKLVFVYEIRMSSLQEVGKEIIMNLSKQFRHELVNLVTFKFFRCVAEYMLNSTICLGYPAKLFDISWD